MKQINVSLTILFSYFPEDLGLDNSISDKEFCEATEKDVAKIVDYIKEMTNLSVNDIEIDVCN